MFGPHCLHLLYLRRWRHLFDYSVRNVTAGKYGSRRRREGGAPRGTPPLTCVDRRSAYTLAWTGPAAAGSPPPIGSLLRLLNMIDPASTTRAAPAIA
jgi:hypothetical protein